MSVAFTRPTLTPRAREPYREATDLHPNLLPAYLGLGRVCLAQGRLDETRTALESARALAPDHPQVTKLGRALEQRKGGG